MQFFKIFAVVFATVAAAAPAELEATDLSVAQVRLPSGCRRSQLAKCVLRLVGTTASCSAAIVEAGANPMADLSCVGSASSTAVKFADCRSCIPKRFEVLEV
ncbi:hypothetical protein E4U21_002207 [Claviceps maximensis]|nr:hypothetical protein E4U21_002207 [Claviceps maximensis]